MKKYHKYIAIAYFSSFIRTLLFLSSIIISIQTLNIAQKITEDSSLSLKTLAIIALNTIPYVLYTITPFVSAITSFNVFNSLLSSSQITILQNARLTNFKIATTHMVVTIPTAILTLYFASFILPKTIEARNTVQDSIVQEKMQNILTPNTIKTFNNFTIITSPHSTLKHIPLTLIHRTTDNGEFTLVGNIQETWSVNKMIGINVNNATILTTNVTGNTLIKFKILETQIDLFPEETKTQDYEYLTTPQLIKAYQTIHTNKYINEINERITPSLLTILLPFAIITMLIKFHSNRARIQVKNILIIILLIVYILFSCYNITDIFQTPKTSIIIYLNILLTFGFICTLNGNIFFNKAQNV